MDLELGSEWCSDYKQIPPTTICMLSTYRLQQCTSSKWSWPIITLSCPLIDWSRTPRGRCWWLKNLVKLEYKVNTVKFDYLKSILFSRKETNCKNKSIAKYNLSQLLLFFLYHNYTNICLWQKKMGHRRNDSRSWGQEFRVNNCLLRLRNFVSQKKTNSKKLWSEERHIFESGCDSQNLTFQYIKSLTVS